MSFTFSDFGLDPHIVNTVAEKGYTEPTDVQEKIIPLMMAGQDVTAQSQTGSGKTAAFALPILSNLRPGKGVQSLILAPTRELAIQVARAIHDYGDGMKVKVLAVYGGQPYGEQIKRLKKGVQVVVGTPGRMLDLIKKGHLNLNMVRTVVLDEADEMLSMGFIEDIELILSETPDSRQTTLFSATLPKQIRKLAQKYMDNPKAVTIERKALTVSTIDQRYYMVNEKDKMSGLTRMFEVEEISSALIFSKTRVSTGELANELTNRGFPAEALNGDLSQDARLRVLNRFRKGMITVLVATDVAARGLDIDDISHVFNYDLPYDPEIYVHRIGRTGRAGKDGVAISIITPRDYRMICRIEEYTKGKIKRSTLPTVKEIWERRESKLLHKMDVWLNRSRAKRERELVEELVAVGHDPMDIAANALKMARSAETQRPIPEIGEVKPARERQRDSRRERGRNGNGRNGNGPKPRRERDANGFEKGMVRMSFGKGRAHGIHPRDVVGSLAAIAKIPGYSIGKIQIKEKKTFLDVPEEYVEKVLSQNPNYTIKNRDVTLKLA